MPNKSTSSSSTSSQAKPAVTTKSSSGPFGSMTAKATANASPKAERPVLTTGTVGSKTTVSQPSTVPPASKPIEKSVTSTQAKPLTTMPATIEKPPTGASPPKKATGKDSGIGTTASPTEKATRPPSAYVAFMDRAMPTPPEASAPINVMVTGAGRGIGLGLVQEFLNNRHIKRVIATVRKAEDSTDIKKKITDSRLIVVTMDISDDQSIEKAYDSVSGILEREGLTLLVNNAGSQILYNVREKPKRADLLRQLDVNSVSPVIVTQTFLPLLLRAAEVNQNLDLSVNRAAVINISDVAGSIALNNADAIVQNPLRMAYRMSKTALNSVTRSLALDLAKDGILVVAICPGSVQTDLGTQVAELTLDESVAVLVPTILGLRTKHNGCFIQRDGGQIVF